MLIVPRMLWVFALLGGCATPSTIAVLSMQDVSCASCGAGVVAALEGVEGVTEATFDAPTAELRVQYDAQRVEVASESSGQALLARGLKAGALVVTVGTAELFGTEFGAAH